MNNDHLLYTQNKIEPSEENNVHVYESICELVFAAKKQL
jgi:hypothetical protein